MLTSGPAATPQSRTLFACAAVTFREPEVAENHQASILMTRVGVPHAGLP